jgi:hypothetical protein
MRYPAILFATLVVAACSAAPGTRSTRAPRSTQAPGPELQTVEQFLLTAAASDSHTHRPPGPARFRDVRIGRGASPDGTRQYILCGQFLPAEGGGTADWTPFATIKTSGYEQWIGAQAGGCCQSSSVIWEDTVGDLSSLLQSRLASLR